MLAGPWGNRGVCLPWWRQETLHCCRSPGCRCQAPARKEWSWWLWVREAIMDQKQFKYEHCLKGVDGKRGWRPCQNVLGHFYQGALYLANVPKWGSFKGFCPSRPVKVLRYKDDGRPRHINHGTSLTSIPKMSPGVATWRQCHQCRRPTNTSWDVVFL